MIKTSEKNVKLQLEDMQRIAKVEETLQNLVREIKIHEDRAKVAKEDVLKLEKYKVYLDEQIGNLETANKTLALENTKLKEDIKKSNITLAKHSEETAKLSKDLDVKMQSINKSNDDLDLREKDFDKKMKSFDKQYKQLQEEKAMVEASKKAFETAINSVKWN